MVNLNQKVELYDPHPGFAGAAVPLPQPMKILADGLAGQSMTLEQALKIIAPAAEKLGGVAAVVEKFDYISFTYHERSGRTHLFRLLRYKQA